MIKVPVASPDSILPHKIRINFLRKLKNKKLKLNLGESGLFKPKGLGNSVEILYLLDENQLTENLYVLGEQIGHNNLGTVYRAQNLATLEKGMVRVHQATGAQIDKEISWLKENTLYTGSATRHTGEQMSVIDKFPGYKFLDIMPHTAVGALKRQLRKRLATNSGQLFTYSDPDSKRNFKIIYTLTDQGYRAFVLGKSIGKGGQGEVFLAQDIASKRWIAVKMHALQPYEDKRDVVLERDNLKKRDRFIGDATTKDGKLLTLMQYFPGDNLLSCLYEIQKRTTDLKRLTSSDVDYYARRKPLSLLKRAEYVISGLGELIAFFEDGFVHRDIKSENFIASRYRFTDMSNLVLVDVGSAYHWKSNPTGEYTPSKGYVAPELNCPLKERPNYTEFQDMFSFGVVAAEIMSMLNYQNAIREFIHSLKFNREMPHDVIMQALSDVLSEDFVQDMMYGEKLSASGLELAKALQAFILNCLEKDFENRPCMDKNLHKTYMNLKLLYTKYSIEQSHHVLERISSSAEGDMGTLMDRVASQKPSHSRSRSITYKSALPSPVGGRVRGFHNRPLSPRSEKLEQAMSQSSGKLVSFSSNTMRGRSSSHRTDSKRPTFLPRSISERRLNKLQLSPRAKRHSSSSKDLDKSNIVTDKKTLLRLYEKALGNVLKIQMSDDLKQDPQIQNLADQLEKLRLGCQEARSSRRKSLRKVSGE